MSRLHFLPDVLRDAGLPVSVYPGWKWRGDPYMNPGGLVWHHTATSKAWNPWHVAQLLYKGRRDLSGPLSQLGLQRDGTWWVIASGVANHAGSGNWKNLYGNRSVVGLEVFSSGYEKWTGVQYQNAVIGSAAILDHMKKDASWLCGHKEWTSRKWDPGGINMYRARNDVAVAKYEGDDVKYVRIEGDGRMFAFTGGAELVALSYGHFKNGGELLYGREPFEEDVVKVGSGHWLAKLPRRNP